MMCCRLFTCEVFTEKETTSTRSQYSLTTVIRNTRWNALTESERQMGSPNFSSNGRDIQWTSVPGNRLITSTKRRMPSTHGGNKSPHKMFKRVNCLRTRIMGLPGGERVGVSLRGL